MKLLWTLLIIMAVLERINASKNSQLTVEIDDLPLTKSLGYSLGKNLRDIEDARMNQEYLEQYQEILKASRETYASVKDDDRDNRRDGRRQRHASESYTPAGRRRARSEALRRQKLNNQSLRSHLEHTRQSSYSYDSQSRDSSEY